MDGVGSSGYGYPGLLGLGLIDDPETLLGARGSLPCRLSRDVAVGGGRHPSRGLGRCVSRMQPASRRDHPVARERGKKEVSPSDILSLPLLRFRQESSRGDHPLPEPE